jgi:hypothetical protein
MTYCDYKSERERLAAENNLRRKMSDTTTPSRMDKVKNELKYDLELLMQPPVLVVFLFILSLLIFAAVLA